MSVIDFDSFISFCKGFQGQRLSTVGGRAWFTLTSAENDKLVYTPESSGKEHRNTRSAIENVLQRYAKNGSLHPGDYKDLTRCASWLLALVKMKYSASPPQKGMLPAEFVEQVRELLRNYDEKG